MVEQSALHYCSINTSDKNFKQSNLLNWGRVFAFIETLELRKNLTFIRSVLVLPNLI